MMARDLKNYPEIAGMLQATEAKRLKDRAATHKQVAFLLKAVDVAAKADPEQAGKYRFALGFVAAQTLESLEDWETVKEIAAE